MKKDDAVKAYYVEPKVLLAYAKSQMENDGVIDYDAICKLL